MKYKSVLQKAGLVVTSILLSLLLAELVLRFIYPAQTYYFVWQPNLQHTFTPDPAIIEGVKSPSSFTINSYGVRTDADEIRHGEEALWFWQRKGKTDSVWAAWCCLCLGGSTTECLYLDDKATWPAQLEKMSCNGPKSMWCPLMGNIGKSGSTSRENYVQLKYCVPQYKKVSDVILMVGLNDLVKRLSQDTLFDNSFHFTQASEDSFVTKIFLKQGRGIGFTWWRRTALFYVLQKAFHHRNGVAWQQMEDDKGEVYKTWRENRQNAAIVIDTLPDLTTALNEYVRNLNLMIDEAQKQKLQITFVNQSALWKDTMTENELAMLWMGGTGNFQVEKRHSYYSPKALRHGLNLYNEKLAEVCAKRNVLLIDIDSKLPHNASTFYDDCHFTITGAQKVGQIVFEGMKNNMSGNNLKK